jgi:GTP-binding protein
MSRPIVAIVGRPNVGKSTLFNKIIKRRKAIVENQPGVTRDRNYHQAQWADRSFLVIDTGGFDVTEEDDVLTAARQQVQMAIEEADMVVLLMDGREGLTPGDREMVDMLRKSHRPFLVAVNKIDTAKQDPLVAEFYSLGLDPLFPISAEHSLGIGSLLDAVVERFPNTEEMPEEERGTRICIVGRPNVGKSSLVNRMLGRERVLVHERPGTTRDSIDTRFTYEGEEYTIIDTAGIRRKGRVSMRLEKFGVIMALKHLQQADIGILLIDSTEGVTEQDSHIAGYVEEAGRGLIVALNKWDAIEKDDRTLGRYVDEVRQKLKFAAYAPILTISALTGQRVNKLFPLIAEVSRHHSQRLPTSEVNTILKEAVEKHHPPLHRGRPIKFYYASQVSSRPPHFVLFTNYPKAVHFSYQRYLENQIRDAHDFTGTPIRLTFRQRQ